MLSLPSFFALNFVTTLAEIEKNEMDRECSRYGGEERCIQGVGGETGGKETTWET